MIRSIFLPENNTFADVKSHFLNTKKKVFSSKFNNAIRLISTSSLDGRLGRQAQKFGPNSAGPVVEGFPAGLPAATPEGVKIALSSPLGKHYFLKVNDTS